MKILLIGDSGVSDWSKKYPGVCGWPNMLAKTHEVTNLGQSGVSEYRILKQLMTVNNLDDYDVIIVSHTSPYRVTTRRHPVHAGDDLHSAADLLYADIEYHHSTWRKWVSAALRSAYGFFKHHYDEEFQETIYTLIREKINNIIGDRVSAILITRAVPARFNTEPTQLNLWPVYNNDRAQNLPVEANHLSKEGNAAFYEQVTAFLDQIEKNG